MDNKFSYEELRRQADKLEEQGNRYHSTMERISTLCNEIASSLETADAATSELAMAWNKFGEQAATSGQNTSSRINQIVAEFTTYIASYQENEQQATEGVQAAAGKYESEDWAN